MIDEEEFARAIQLVDDKERQSIVRELAARINRNRRDSMQRLSELDRAMYEDILGGDDIHPIYPFLHESKDREE